MWFDQVSSFHILDSSHPKTGAQNEWNQLSYGNTYQKEGIHG